MSIYTSYHPTDGLFAAELLTYLRNSGFTPKAFPLSCDQIAKITLAKTDNVIVILRPEYVKSPVYARLSEQLSDVNILPILRAPIAIEDWSERITLNPVADFSGHDEEQILFNMELLSKLLTSYGEFRSVIKPNAKETYVNSLEATLLQADCSLTVLENINYEYDSPAKNPIYALLAETQFKVSSTEAAGFSVGDFGRERIDYLENIANYHGSFTLVCDYLDSYLVMTFMVDIARQQFNNSSGKTPIPVMLDVENWDKETPWNKWLARQINFSNGELEDLIVGNLVLYAYGFEYSPLNVGQFRESFKVWWNSSSPPPPLVIVCPYLGDAPTNSLDDITLIVRPVQCDLAQLKRVCSKYSNRSFAQFLLRRVDTDEDFPLLRYFLENPAFAVSLLSVKFGQGVEFSKQKLGDFFRHFVCNLWGLENYKNEGDFSEINDALSKIAAIVTEHRKSFISYDEALNFFQSEALLSNCIDRGIFVFKNNKLRFSTLMIQNYFASIALVQYGIPSQLPRLTLSTEYGRVPQRWDNSVIISSHIIASPDEMLKTIADVDPLLALRCLASGILLNAVSYSYVIDKNLDALVSVGDFRIGFAKLLYKIDPGTAKSIFVEVLRNARWSIRMYANSMFQELNKSTLPGLVESLTSVNDLTRDNVSHAVRRIGSNVLPTLFQLLHYDNVATRLNAIWAISELNDKACVPALVKMLEDNNLLVVIQAVDTLGKFSDIHSVPYLVRYLQHRHIGIRKSVINALIEIQNKQSELFIEIVQQMSTASRRLLVAYLSTSRINTLCDFLLAFSYDEDVDVKIAAIEGLATIAEPRVISRLEECLEDMSKSWLYKSSVNEIVSRILSNIPGYADGKTRNDKGQKRVSFDDNKTLNSSQIVKSRLLNAKEQRLVPTLLNSPENIHPQSDQSIVNLDVSKTDFQLLSPEDAYVSDILAQLRSGKWNASSKAAKILRDYVKTLRGNTTLRVVNQILETLNDDDWVIRWTGVETLSWVGNVHVVPHLIQRLTDSNWKVRIAAIRALVEIKDTKAIIAISKLVSDNNPLVREAAAEALGYLDGSQAIPALESATMDSEEFVRLAAVESLGKTHNKIATQTLLFSLKDSSEHVRWAAANGLSGIADADLVSVLIPSLSDSAGPYWEQKRICDVIVDILKQINTEEAKLAIMQWQSNQT